MDLWGAMRGATGERHAPERVRSLEAKVLDIVHLYAYVVALEIVTPSDRVLEVGFGEAYGAALLGKRGARYAGLEVDRATVSRASARYGSDEIAFRFYDGSSFPFPDASFDFTFSSQVIEHVKDVDRYCSEIARTLAPGGRGLIVTPNRAYRLAPGERPWNRYHLVEYDAAAFEALLSRHFRGVEIRGMRTRPEVEQVEVRRVARLRRLARIDRLGFRYTLPPVLVKLVSDALQRLRPTTARDSLQMDDVTLEDVYDTEKDIDQSLNLMAIIRN